MKNIITFIGIVLLFGSCQSIKDREIASDSDSTELLIDRLNQGDAQSEIALAAKIRGWLMTVAWTQQLQASFDLYLDSKINSSSSSKADIQDSEVTCKLWESYYFYHEAEDSLQDIQKIFITKNIQSGYDWFLHLFGSTKADTPDQIMAKAQLIRMLQSSHKELCENKSCVEFLKFPGKPYAAFDPFNDQEMLDFKKKFAKKISIYTTDDINSMPLGTCIDHDRKPSSDEVSTYDWKKRNKTGLGLKSGEYIFTYDDGPHVTYTMQLVDLWEKSGMAKPTFFWLAMNAQRYPDVIRQVRDRGFEIAVHSWSHPDVGALAKATSKENLGKVNRSLWAKEISSVSNVDFPTWREKMLDHQIIDAFQTVANEVGNSSKVTKFRLPYGSGVRNDKIGRRFSQLNVDHYFWAIDSLDWSDRNPASIVERVHKGMAISKKGIILFHDIHPQSVAATKLLIQEFKENKNGEILGINEKSF